jgi:sulfhydrogenase subunit beta (sulfur reductase)
MTALLERASFDALLGALRGRGYTVIGPTVRDGAIVCAEVESVQDLPAGWVDEQEAGRYRLRHTGEPVLFGHTVGPIAWKRFLFPPAVRLWRTESTGHAAPSTGTGGGAPPAGTMDLPAAIQSDGDPLPRYAFIGVRACDLEAIAIQDRVFLMQPYVDRTYEARRDGAFIIVVHCTRPGATCFCASTGTGPRAAAGYDLALTEVCRDGRHHFLVESGSTRGEEVLADLPLRDASPEERDAGEAAVAGAADLMGRRVDLAGLKDLLYRSYDHPRWDEIAARCLACANCTLVCPTCYCTAAEERTDLEGQAEHWRRWDSCFSGSFSHIHGGSIRASVKSRYRQWLVHKFATWIDQFGTTGCVGCGRCITWCPAAIDVTEEVRALQDREVALHGDA